MASRMSCGGVSPVTISERLTGYVADRDWSPSSSLTTISTQSRPGFWRMDDVLTSNVVPGNRWASEPRRNAVRLLSLDPDVWNPCCMALPLIVAGPGGGLYIHLSAIRKNYPEPSV